MAASLASAGFVGRARELATLSAAIEQAASGRPATVLVAGVAGVGKSRLVAESAGAATHDGALVLVGRCVDIGDGELAYAPVRGALRGLVGRLGDAELAEVLGAGRVELARLVPALAGPNDAATDSAVPFGKERLFEFLLTALSRLGERQPVVLVIEDLHWSDNSTRDLLRFLVRAGANERLCLILTCRTDELDRDDPVRPYLTEMRRDPRVVAVDVEPFSRAELAEQVTAILGTRPAPATLDDLYARTEGNPFYTEEFLGAPSARELPATLRETMTARLRPLSAETRDVVRILAAFGRQVDHSLLERAAAISDHQLRRAVGEARDAGILAVTTEGHGYEFRHALLREVAYTELLPGDRRDLHAAIARAIEAEPGDSASSTSELALHWDAAGDGERALPALDRAARSAERVYAHPEALRHLQRALELWASVSPDVRGRVDRLALTERAAEAASAAGDARLAVTLAEHAVSLAGPEAAARQYALLARLLWDDDRGVDSLAASERAVANTPPERTLDRARTLESHARLLLLGGRVEQAVAPIDEAIAIARELGAQDVEAAALTTRVIALGGRNDAPVAAGREALRAAQLHGDGVTLMRAYINASEALDHAGEVDASIELAGEGVDQARRFGMERMMGAHLRAEMAGRLLKLGRWADTVAILDEAWRAAPEGTAASALHQVAALLAAHRGDTAAVATHRGAISAEPGSGQSTARGAAAAAEDALWIGDADGAWQIVTHALTLVEHAEYVWYSAPLYSLGAWACADQALEHRATGDDRRAATARRHAEALRNRLELLVQDADVPELAAHRAQVDAELTRLLDIPDPAAWEAVRTRWEQLGFVFHAAIGAMRQAEALLLLGADRDRAAELLTDTAARADELGARPLADAVTALARRARVPLNATTHPDDAPAGLTPRELDVLRLIAAGQTNRQIGAELFISAKTVGVHVSRILTKLGASNRAQAATIAHRLGITPPTHRPVNTRPSR